MGEGCSKAELMREKPWVMPYDVGLPAAGFFYIVVGTLIYCAAFATISVLFTWHDISKPSVEDNLIKRFLKSKELWYRMAFVVVALAYGLPNMLHSCQHCDKTITSDYCNNWLVMFLYGLVFITTTHVARRPLDFFLGEGVTLGDNLKFFFRGQPMPTTEEIEAASRAKERTVEGHFTIDRRVGYCTLLPSAFISWVFAKSIRNSAVLGGRYGMLGGLGYASWYVSFITVGIVCYRLRTRYNFQSFTVAVYKNYGVLGVICFQLCVLFRLFNEIWSNSTVVGSFYGPQGSSGYWGAAWLSTLIPLSYIMIGGMRAALVTDAVHAYLGVIFLIVVLAAIGADKTFTDNAVSTFKYEPTKLYKATQAWDGGWWALFLGGLIQGAFSYPFQDPVITDRGFLSDPKTMLISMVLGGIIAGAFIFFYAALGVYGAFYHEYFMDVCGCANSFPTGVTVTPRPTPKTNACPTDWNPCERQTWAFGDPAYTGWVLGHKTFWAVDAFVIVTMLASSMSVLDSCFIAWGKMVSLEWGGWFKLDGDKRGHIGPLKPYDDLNIGQTHMMLARFSMVVLLIVGNAFLGMEKDAMSATDAAGTMVMGIGIPIWAMCFWRVKKPGQKGWVQAPLAFVVPFVIGCIFGWYYYDDGKTGTGWTYDTPNFIIGKSDKQPNGYYYSRFLGVNLWGHLICAGAFVVCFIFHQLFPGCWFYRLQEVEEETDEVTLVGKFLQRPDEVAEQDDAPAKVAAVVDASQAEVSDAAAVAPPAAVAVEPHHVPALAPRAPDHSQTVESI